MAFQISPGVNVSEIDLTTVVPSVSTTAGAFAGRFQWGPVEKRVLVTSESEIVSRFGEPNTNTYTSFFTAANFLAYGNNLNVARASNTSSLNASANGGVRIINEDIYDAAYANTGGTNSIQNGTFAARYPGALGNSLKVSVCDNSTGFATWTYKSNFSSTPNTSSFVAAAGGSRDQLHVAVIDASGSFTGTKGTVLEVFPFLSKASDATFDDGSSAYYRNVIREKSAYVYSLAPVDFANTSSTWGNDSTTNFALLPTNIDVTLTGGSSTTVQDADTIRAWDQFSNGDVVDISLVPTGDASVTVQQYVIDNIATSRKDCIAFVSPRQADVVNASGSETTNITTWNGLLGRSTSYAFADSGWKYQFDKYNNVYRWIPANGDMAGLCVRTDETRDPWFSPAGFSRGAIKNAVKLSWNPNQAQRDVLYAMGVNPLVSFPGQGIILYGDKTLLAQPSVFDRINTRRLFIILEKAIAKASKYSLFELNDEFTRSQFVSLVEPFLRDIKGRRGIYDFRVVCDTTNNTPQVIDSNRFIGDIYIKPARSINFIQLNFVAVRSGVNFSEVVGAF